MNLIVKSPPLADGEYGVVLCEVDTGIVLLPDGRRALGSEPYHEVFTSLHGAMDYAEEQIDRNPNWEGHLYDPSGRHLKSVRPDPAP